MVGHTHEDIDQMFSCISRRLAKFNARTLLELIREIGLSYSPAIVASIITFMYDVRGWLESFFTPNVNGHIHQHQFKLARGPEGKALLFCKKWSTTKEWSPQSGIQLLTGTPRGRPLLIEPIANVDKTDLQKLEQDLPKYGMHFDEATKEWWKNFISNKGGEKERPNWVLPQLKPLSAMSEEMEEEPTDIPDGLVTLMNREEREIEVLNYLLFS